MNISSTVELPSLIALTAPRRLNSISLSIFSAVFTPQKNSTSSSVILNFFTYSSIALRRSSMGCVEPLATAFISSVTFLVIAFGTIFITALRNAIALAALPVTTCISSEKVLPYLSVIRRFTSTLTARLVSRSWQTPCAVIVLPSLPIMRVATRRFPHAPATISAKRTLTPSIGLLPRARL